MNGQVQCREWFSSRSAAQTRQPISHHDNYAHVKMLRILFITSPIYRTLSIIGSDKNRGLTSRQTPRSIFIYLPASTSILPILLTHSVMPALYVTHEMFQIKIQWKIVCVDWYHESLLYIRFFKVWGKGSGWEVVPRFEKHVISARVEDQSSTRLEDAISSCSSAPKDWMKNLNLWVWLCASCGPERSGQQGKRDYTYKAQLPTVGFSAGPHDSPKQSKQMSPENRKFIFDKKLGKRIKHRIKYRYGSSELIINPMNSSERTLWIVLRGSLRWKINSIG